MRLVLNQFKNMDAHDVIGATKKTVVSSKVDLLFKMLIKKTQKNPIADHCRLFLRGIAAV